MLRIVAWFCHFQICGSCGRTVATHRRSFALTECAPCWAARLHGRDLVAALREIERERPS